MTFISSGSSFIGLKEEVARMVSIERIYYGIFKNTDDFASVPDYGLCE